MKRKILLLNMFVAIGLSGFAQSLSVASLDYHVWSSVEQTVSQSVGTIENVGSSTIAVKVRRITVDTVPGSQNYFCWEQCYIPSIDVSPTAMTMAPGQQIDQFYADYKANGNAGVSVLTYCFYDVNNEADSVCATVRFHASAVGITDVFKGNESGISDAYPNPARTVANINFALKQGWQQADLFVYSMLGSQVKKVSLLEDQGTYKLDVSRFPAGMYFYTLEVDGKAISTKKMLVTE